MKKTIAIISLLSIFIISNAFAFGGMGDKGRGQGFDRMIEKLDLTDDQISKIKEIREACKNKFTERHEKIQNLKEELSTAMRKPAKGKEYQKTLKEKYDKLQTEIMEKKRERFETSLKIRELLTAEQIKEFRSFHRGRGRGRGGRGQGRGRGRGRGRG